MQSTGSPDAITSKDEDIVNVQVRVDGDFETEKVENEPEMAPDLGKGDAVCDEDEVSLSTKSQRLIKSGKWPRIPPRLAKYIRKPACLRKSRARGSKVSPEPDTDVSVQTPSLASETEVTVALPPSDNELPIPSADQPSKRPSWNQGFWEVVVDDESDTSSICSISSDMNDSDVPCAITVTLEADVHRSVSGSIVLSLDDVFPLTIFSWAENELETLDDQTPTLVLSNVVTEIPDRISVASCGCQDLQGIKKRDGHIPTRVSVWKRARLSIGRFFRKYIVCS